MTHTLEHHIAFDRHCQQSSSGRHIRAGRIPSPGTIVARVRQWNQQRHQRQALVDLDDRLLQDIGVSREEADRASAGLFWRTYARRHLK